MTGVELTAAIAAHLRVDKDFDPRDEGMRLAADRIEARVSNAHVSMLYMLKAYGEGREIDPSGHIAIELGDFMKLLADIVEANGVIEGLM